MFSFLDSCSGDYGDLFARLDQEIDLALAQTFLNNCKAGLYKTGTTEIDEKDKNEALSTEEGSSSKTETLIISPNSHSCDKSLSTCGSPYFSSEFATATENEAFSGDFGEPSDLPIIKSDQNDVRHCFLDTEKEQDASLFSEQMQTEETTDKAVFSEDFCMGNSNNIKDSDIPNNESKDLSDKPASLSEYILPIETSLEVFKNEQVTTHDNEDELRKLIASHKSFRTPPIVVNSPSPLIVALDTKTTKKSRPAIAVMTSHLHKVVICDECDNQEAFIDDMKKHFEDCHDPLKISFQIKYKTETSRCVEGAELMKGNKLFTCNKCNYLTNKTSNIKQHLSGKHKHEKEKEYSTCYKLGYEPGEEKWLMGAAATNPQNSSQESMMEEKIAAVEKPKVYSCEACGYSSQRKQCLKKHIQSKHEGFRYACHQCENKFLCPAALKDHIASKHQNKFYQCTVCNWRGSHRTSLKRHIETKHAENKRHAVKCNACDYVGRDATTLKMHIKNRHENEMVDCSQCHFKAEEASILKRHVLFCHATEEDVLTCTTCSASLDSRFSIIRHMLEAHELELDEKGGLYACQECQFKTKTKGTLTRHKEQLHSKIYYDCDYCGYKSRNPWTLKRHLFSRHQMVVEKCDLKPR